MHPGSQQDRRLSRALQDGFLSPDELTLAQRLRQLLLLAQALLFTDISGQPSPEARHWGDVLARDDSLLLADIAAFPIDRIEARLLDELARPPSPQQGRLCQDLLQQLDAWCVALDAQHDPLDLLADLRRQLQAQVQQQIGPMLHGLDRPLPSPPPAHRHWRAALTREPVVSTLRQLALALCRSIRLLADTAQAQLLPSLRSGQHEPAIGLLLAAQQLLHQSREPLHRFADRLTDHYYLERLGLRPLQRQGDRIHVLLTRDPRGSQALAIPAGTRLVCGRDAQGASRIYRSEQALELSTLQVSQLLMLRLVQQPQISPEHELAYASAAKATRLSPPTPEAAALARAPSWPLLGGGDGPDCRDAELGLALASPLLELAEGERLIELRLSLGQPGAHDAMLKRLLQRPAARRSRAWLLRVQRLLARHEATSGGGAASWLEDSGQSLPRREALAHPARQERLALLRLAHGHRRFCCEQPWIAYLLLRTLQCEQLPAPQQAEALSERLGRLFAVWLCQSEEDFDRRALLTLQRLSRQIFVGQPGQPLAADDPLSLVFGRSGRGTPERDLLLDRVFRGLWQCRLSTATGWLEIDAVQTSAAALPGVRGRQLRLQLLIGPGHPAITGCRPELHGTQWPRQPVLQLRMRGRARLFGVSLLQQLTLERIALHVEVRGLRQLLLYNQLGRLDAGKPFAPFGPLPDTSSYLVFSSSEIAAKPLDALRLSLRWAGLPTHGLAAHYTGYPGGPWQRDSFRVASAVLSDGSWRASSAAPLALFGDTAQQTLDWQPDELASLHRPASGLAAPSAEFSLASRQGFFRLQLAAPVDGFGHALYPRLLTEVLTRNARLKRQQPLPQAPYTPMLDQISLSYASSAQLRLLGDADRSTAPGASDTTLWRIAPFGLEPLRAGHGPCPLLLPWPAPGQLFIGLSGECAEGLLNLLFQLESEAAREALGEPTPALHWAAWCGAQGWQPLPAYRILEDQTQGMLRSGLVVLDLPRGMSRDCPAMPADRFWLRLSASGVLERLAPLRGVWAQGLSARAETPTDASLAPAQVLPPHSVKSLDPPVPGVVGLTQPLPGFDLRPAEDRNGLRRRAAERLRHRERASTPWDYERLVLQAFPEVFKVKCMPQRPGGEGAGKVLVVVVPALPPGFDIDGTEAPRLDAATLQRIQQHLLERCAPGVRILVRNAGYERIQVRCALRLADGVNSGLRLRELNQALRDFLSPWRDSGLSADFGWRITTDEIEAMLRAQPGVEAVGQVSLLHIVRSDGGRHRLRDSARASRSGPLTPAYRWNLALPMRRHLITLSDQPGERGPQATGLSLLALGDSFIIRGSSP